MFFKYKIDIILDLIENNVSAQKENAFDDDTEDKALNNRYSPHLEPILVCVSSAKFLSVSQCGNPLIFYPSDFS